MAAKNSPVSAVGKRYATALFEMARDGSQLDQVAADLDGIERLLNESDDLRRLVRSPVFSRDDQKNAMAAVLEKAGISDLTRRFIGVVAQNRRLFALDGMIADYRAMLARHRGETLAEVISASPLTEAQTQSLRDALAKAAAGKIVLNSKVDPTLIGGLVIRLGSRMVDASVRAKLNALKTAMKGVA